MNARLVETATGRPCVSARWGISIGAADVAFQLACTMAGTRENPLHLADEIAERFRVWDQVEMDSPLA